MFQSTILLERALSYIHFDQDIKVVKQTMEFYFQPDVYRLTSKSKEELYATLLTKYQRLNTYIGYTYDNSKFSPDIDLKSLKDKAAFLSRIPYISRRELKARTHLYQIYTNIIEYINIIYKGQFNVPGLQLDQRFSFIPQKNMIKDQIYSLPHIKMYDFLIQEDIIDTPILVFKTNLNSMTSRLQPNPLDNDNDLIRHFYHLPSCIISLRSWLQIPNRSDPLSNVKSYPLFLIPFHRKVDKHNDNILAQELFKDDHEVHVCFAFLYYLLYRWYKQRASVEEQDNLKILEIYTIYRFDIEQVPLDLRYNNYLFLPITSLQTALNFCLHIDPIKPSTNVLLEYKEAFNWYKAHSSS